MEINIINESGEETLSDDIRISRITIAAKRKNKYLFVKCRGSNTMELVSTDVNESELPLNAARRLLVDTLGVSEYQLKFVCNYSITENKSVEYGVLYSAEVAEMGDFEKSRIATVYLLDDAPESNSQWTNPERDMLLFQTANRK